MNGGTLQAEQGHDREISGDTMLLTACLKDHIKTCVRLATGKGLLGDEDFRLAKSELLYAKRRREGIFDSFYHTVMELGLSEDLCSCPVHAFGVDGGLTLYDCYDMMDDRVKEFVQTMEGKNG